MRAICAWCKAEGRPADLGEREPLDDTSETHGLCPTHLATVLAQLPSISFPGVQLLIVVEDGDAGLFHHLSRSMAAITGVKVIRERRLQEQRRASDSVLVDRRRGDRRQSRDVRRSMGCMFIRFGPKISTSRSVLESGDVTQSA
jgi:hypothetical protein